MLINCNCGSRTAVGVLFFCFAKRKYPKKKATPVASPLAKSERAVPCAPHRPRARAELAGAQRITARARARTSSRDNPSGSAAVLGLLYGGEQQQPLCSE